MGLSRSWAKIEFPVRMIDEEIRKHLEVEYGEEFDRVDTENENGIFSLEDGEAVCGEFEDLEALLIDKEIPFDRETAMDWQQPPCLRIYRPAHETHGMALDFTIPLNENGEEMVTVSQIRELLDNNEAPASAIQAYLDESYTYPHLADFVKED